MPIVVLPPCTHLMFMSNQTLFLIGRDSQPWPPKVAWQLRFTAASLFATSLLGVKEGFRIKGECDFKLCSRKATCYMLSVMILPLVIFLLDGISRQCDIQIYETFNWPCWLACAWQKNCLISLFLKKRELGWLRYRNCWFVILGIACNGLLQKTMMSEYGISPCGPVSNKTGWKH